MALRLALDVSYAARRPWAPSSRLLAEWAAAALSLRKPVGLSVRIVGNARSQRAGRQPPWLGMCDEAVDSAAHFQAVLRQLSALPGAGVAGHDEHPMPVQGGDDLLAPRRNRQIGIVLED